MPLLTSDREGKSSSIKLETRKTGNYSTGINEAHRHVSCMLCAKLLFIIFPFWIRSNVHIGSGLASCILQYKEGPIAMIKGFAFGYSLLYMMDKVSENDIWLCAVDR